MICVMALSWLQRNARARSQGEESNALTGLPLALSVIRGFSALAFVFFLIEAILGVIRNAESEKRDARTA